VLYSPNVAGIHEHLVFKLTLSTLNIDINTVLFKHAFDIYLVVVKLKITISRYISKPGLVHGSVLDYNGHGHIRIAFIRCGTYICFILLGLLGFIDLFPTDKDIWDCIEFVSVCVFDYLVFIFILGTH
jgi:hypothetical protein